MKTKPIATAFKLHKNGHDVDPDIKFSCHNTRWMGVVYIATSDISAKKILNLGYRLPIAKLGGTPYYVLKEK